METVFLALGIVTASILTAGIGYLGLLYVAMFIDDLRERGER